MDTDVQLSAHKREKRVGKGLALHLVHPAIKRDLSHQPVAALFSVIGCAISIGLMATVAYFSRSPFLFPSLGPTAFLFFSCPTERAASARNTIIGHTIGVLAGYFSLLVTGLTMAGPALAVGVSSARIIAVALSLALTAALMILFRASHPPAGATTLMVSLGILSKPEQLEVVMVAVALLTLFALLFNRLAGLLSARWILSQQDGMKTSKFAGKEGSKAGSVRMTLPKGCTCKGVHHPDEKA